METCGSRDSGLVCPAPPRVPLSQGHTRLPTGQSAGAAAGKNDSAGQRDSGRRPPPPPGQEGVSCAESLRGLTCRKQQGPVAPKCPDLRVATKSVSSILPTWCFSPNLS